MNKTQLNLKTVTPMFLRGSDNSTPELRTPPFKSLFRYWWRTVQDYDVNSLRKNEAELFGSTDVKSPFSLRISVKTDPSTTEYELLPHKPGRKTCAINIEQPIELHLTTKTDTDYHRIAKLGFLLGGVGARSRRGFGSIRDTDWKYTDVSSLRDEIFDTLNTVAKDDRFKINKNSEINNRTVEIIEAKRRIHFPPEYPVIQRIFFGQLTNDMDELLKNIGQATSDAKRYNKDDTLGGGVPRMASPVIVRIQLVNSHYIPIVTQLFSPYPMSSYTGRNRQQKPSQMPMKQLRFIYDIIK